MTMGAEPKKVVALVGLVAVAVIVYWMNSSSDAPASTAVVRPAADAVAPAPGTSALPQAHRRRDVIGKPGSTGDHVVKLINGVDPSKVDPTIRFDLLAKVQAVGVEGGARNIFQPSSDPELVKAQKQLEIAKVAKINMMSGPQPPPIKEQASVQVPPPPTGPIVTPIDLKYYGYSTKRSDGEKKAFFLDGEEIIVAAEGEIIKKHYKVLRIGVSSVQMEDTASKSSQTLPIQADASPV